MIAALSLAAHALRNADARTTHPQVPTSAMSPWIVGIVTLLFGFPWYALMGLVFVPRHNIPLSIPLLATAAWATLAYLIARWFSRSPGWNDIDRWSAVFYRLAGLHDCRLSRQLNVVSHGPCCRNHLECRLRIRIHLARNKKSPAAPTSHPSKRSPLLSGVVLKKECPNAVKRWRRRVGVELKHNDL